MWLTDLAKVARRTGYPVKEIAGWKRRGRAPMSGVRSIICHHTAGGSRGNAPSLGVVKNGRPGIPGPLAQIVLGRDGTIYIVAAGRSNHAGRVSATRYTNSYAIGIEAENTGREKWPARQMDAYAKLCRALCDHYKVPISQVRGHKEVARPKGRKPDPSFSMDAFREMVRKRKGAPVKGGTTSSKTYREVKYGDLLRLHTKGAPVREWQRTALGYTGKKADGYFGPSTEADTKRFQREHGVTADGVVGPTTWPLRLGKKPQPKPAPKPATKKRPAAPKFPLPKGWYFGPRSGPKRSVSGYHGGRNHLKVWQSQMRGRGWKITADGLYGPQTQRVARAFQKEKGLSVDGLIGKSTWEAAWKAPVT